ncbi:hypothetical protein KNO15_13215 [Leifsonia shinshuensis]|uniref:hypothetical protein n=1 Tax=Leifsonia shinshuensis TaxID=150026 RepID=UPI001F50DF8E|nr:hypothetical protein [Leifsonia shinshuensis]MCI0157654.1 hypothetical protein [Leifsonia shinshuensis]
MSDRNELRVTADSLIVRPRGWDRLWCCRREVVVPLTSITDVRIEHAPSRIPTGWRGPGLDFMGKLSGTFHPNGERHFWNYSGSGDALGVAIDQGQHFQQLYLSVGDAERSKQALLDALSDR